MALHHVIADAAAVRRLAQTAVANAKELERLVVVQEELHALLRESMVVLEGAILMAEEFGLKGQPLAAELRRVLPRIGSHLPREDTQG